MTDVKKVAARGIKTVQTNTGGYPSLWLTPESFIARIAAPLYGMDSNVVAPMTVIRCNASTVMLLCSANGNKIEIPIEIAAGGDAVRKVSSTIVTKTVM